MCVHLSVQWCELHPVSPPLKQCGPGWFENTGRKKAKKCHRSPRDLRIMWWQQIEQHLWCVDFNSRVWRRETRAVPRRHSAAVIDLRPRDLAKKLSTF